MAKLYASLTGPLLDVYFPLPEGMDEMEAREALNKSSLANLWCSVYDEKWVDEEAAKYGPVLKLDDRFARRLG